MARLPLARTSWEWTRMGGPCGLCAGILGLWEVSARTGLYNPALLPPPGRVFSAWWELLSTGVLVPAILASIQRVLLGFILAAMVAGSVAILMARFEMGFR